jgi:cell division initiation protein
MTNNSIKISPQDILSQEFKTKIKGYDKEEVKNFLLSISESIELENSEKENSKKELEQLKININKLEKRENVLRDTLISAQKFSKEIKNNAEREVQLIIKEAEMRAEDIVNQARERQRSLNGEIKNLKFKRKEIENDLLNMLNSLKDLIESYRKEDEEFDKIEFLG